MQLTNSLFDPIAYWTKPIKELGSLEMFDQNGYDLSPIEQQYAKVNAPEITLIRGARVALCRKWFEQTPQLEGPALNHALLFERKGYAGAALAQLQEFAQIHPVLYKIINIRPKWGLDFSMDYYDRQGNTMEILHWEYDSFNVLEILEVKDLVDPILSAIDWDDAARELLKRKDEWHGLDFFAQSDYKCQFFGLRKEQFKMVIWK